MPRKPLSSGTLPPWTGLLLALGVLACLAAAVVAWGATPVPDWVPGQGGIRIVPRPDPDTGQVDPDAPRDLPLKHTDVKAEISGLVSRVTVEQVFTNPCDDPIEAVYAFPLPENAAVGDMEIRIGDRVIKGVIREREEAREIYEQARNEGKTAALLEQERPNIFTQSVANIMPGNDIVVRITYDQVLKYEKGGYEFVFPMVVGPRYVPGASIGRQADGWSPDTDQAPDASRITPPVLKPGERNGHDIALKVDLHAPIPIRNLHSPSHNTRVMLGTDSYQTERLYGLNVDSVKMEPTAGDFVVSLATHDTIPNKDFVLRYEVAGDMPQMGLLATNDRDAAAKNAEAEGETDGRTGGHFLLMFQPPARPAPDTVTPKEMIFVLDCSGSMSGEPISISKKAMRHALSNLNPDDTFQIIRFSESASPFAEAPLPNTPENVRAGLSYINGLNTGGGTEMLQGIRAALDYPHEEGRLRIVCFMTDGYIGNEPEILAAIEERLGDDTRLFSFGIGSSVNRYLLERMAEVGLGAVHYILLNEDPQPQIEKFYDRVRNPVLTHIRIDWGKLDVEDVTPARVPDLFTGQPLLVLGRYDQGGKATVKVHARLGGEDRVFPLQVSLPSHESENAAVGALWARSRIEGLMAEQNRGEDQDVKGEVTDLALRYRLMSAYTSFVAVEERIVNEDGAPRTVQVPVEMPEGVSYEGVFGPADAPYPNRHVKRLATSLGVYPSSPAPAYRPAPGMSNALRAAPAAEAMALSGSVRPIANLSLGDRADISAGEGSVSEGVAFAPSADVKALSTREARDVAITAATPAPPRRETTEPEKDARRRSIDKLAQNESSALVSPVERYTIELRLEIDGHTQTIRVSDNGEVWIEGYDPATRSEVGRLLVGRLRRDERRQLAALLTAALENAPQDAVAYSRKGRILIRVPLESDTGKKTREVTVDFDPKAGQTSETWRTLIDRIVRLADR